MNADQDGVTVKGISPRVIWPSEASTCQRRRYVPAAKPVASAESVSAGVCLLISSVCAKPSERMSVKRERRASMRTLNRSLIGTSGPVTALFRVGLDSRRIACAAAGGTLKKATTTANKMSAQRFRRAGCITILFAKKSEKLRKRRVSPAEGKLYRSRGGLLIHLGIAAQTVLSLPPAEERRMSAGEIWSEASRNYSCEPISLL